MSAIIRRFLKCDGCGRHLGQMDSFQQQFDGKIQAETKTIEWQRAIAKHHGWARGRYAGDYCAACVRRNRPARYGRKAFSNLNRRSRDYHSGYRGQ